MTDASGRRVHVTPFTADELWQAAAGAVLAVGTLRHLQRKVRSDRCTVLLCVSMLAFDLSTFFFVRWQARGLRISTMVLGMGVFTNLLRRRMVGIVGMLPLLFVSTLLSATFTSHQMNAGWSAMW